MKTKAKIPSEDKSSHESGFLINSQGELHPLLHDPNNKAPNASAPKGRIMIK